MAGALVDRATSHMLIGPDWAMNVQICDILNRDPGYCCHNFHMQLQLLETVTRSCGDVVHMHVAEKDILHKMVKIVKKKQAGAVFPQRTGRSASIFTPQNQPLTLYPPSVRSTDDHQEVPETSVGSDFPALSLIVRLGLVYL
ncbi:hypothetical protein BHM03_00030550 [Ensete ventricosum]|nr:hypothetical protein BHM03_00030550 [Ensete ventricosum]